MGKNSGRDLLVLDKRERKTVETVVTPADQIQLVLKGRSADKDGGAS